MHTAENAICKVEWIWRTKLLSEKTITVWLSDNEKISTIVSGVHPLRTFRNINNRNKTQLRHGLKSVLSLIRKEATNNVYWKKYCPYEQNTLRHKRIILCNGQSFDIAFVVQSGSLWYMFHCRVLCNIMSHVIQWQQNSKELLSNCWVFADRM